MPRRVEDIVSRERRSIREVSIDKQNRAADISSKKSPIEKEREVPLHRISSLTPPSEGVKGLRATRSVGKNGKWLIGFLAIIILAAIAAYIATVYFSKAYFTIMPKDYRVSVDDVYSASSLPGSAFQYKLVPLSGTASSTVPAVDGPAVSVKAEGSATLFNENSQSQRLVAGTRLTDNLGRTYRTESSVTVPAAVLSKSVSTSGSIGVKIIADQPGESYNITGSGTVSDLKVTAFKGTDKYETVYARLTSDVSGGFSGKKKVVTASILASTTDALKSKLTAELISKAGSAVPPSQISFDGAYIVSAGIPMISGGDSASAVVTLAETLYVVTFDRAGLVDKLAGATTTSAFGKFSYDTVGLESLSVSIANAKDFSPQTNSPLAVKMSGSFMLIGRVPVDEIKGKLMGMQLSDMKKILSPYDSVVDSVSGELIPPWTRIPTDISRISVTVQPK